MLLLISIFCFADASVIGVYGTLFCNYFLMNIESNIIALEIRYLMVWKLMTMLMVISNKDPLIPINSLKYNAVAVEMA